MKILFDLNILLDIYSKARQEKFSSSLKCFEILKNSGEIFISASSIDNFEFICISELKRNYFKLSTKDAKSVTHEVIKEILSFFKIAKTPSYLDFDFNDLEDSLVLASAKAISAKLLTRDEILLKNHPEICISPKDFLNSLDKKKPIDFANLKLQHIRYQSEFEENIDAVLNKANFIMGDEVALLEDELCKYTSTKHCITCSNGTDALLLAAMSLGLKSGDEVITTPFTFISTSEILALIAVKPVFVDIDEKTYNINADQIEAKITPKTKAILPVSLYGQPADMDKISAIAKKHNLKVIIDGAQSFGSEFNGVKDSTLGDIATTSFFPSKPLGCYGDGGAVFTNDDELAFKIKQLRIHGQNSRYHHKFIGLGARLDTIQAAVLRVKLKHYKDDLALRQKVAKKYDEALRLKSDIILPFIDSRAVSAYAQYSIRVKDRETLQTKLKAKGIPTAIHYPKPLHLQECFNYLGYKNGDFPVSERVSNEILSLPMNPYLSDDEINFIAENL